MKLSIFSPISLPISFTPTTVYRELSHTYSLSPTVACISVDDVFESVGVGRLLLKPGDRNQSAVEMNRGGDEQRLTDKSESGDRRNRRKKYQPRQHLVSTFLVTLTSSWQPIRKGPSVSPW